MDYSILIYGKTKIGKTTWAAGAKDALFLATEPGQNAQSVWLVKVDKWETLLQALKEVEAAPGRFSTVVIDTIDNAYVFCMQYVCRTKLGAIDHPADASFGKGFAAVNNEFRRVLLKLSSLDIGIILISHSQVKTIETKTSKHDLITTTLPESARKIVLGLMDIVLLADLKIKQTKDGYQEKRIVHTKPSVSHDAGDRTGRLPDILPLDYQAFVKAFDASKPNKKESKR